MWMNDKDYFSFLIAVGIIGWAIISVIHWLITHVNISFVW